VRRIAPALMGVIGLADLAPSAPAPAEGEPRPAPKIDLATLADKIEPFLAALGNMTDENADYVIDTCLSVVERKVGGDRGWQKIGTGGALMYDDIDLATMLQLVFRAGAENLSGFFDAAMSMFPGAKAPA
jgi:hypothetical protein